MGNYYCCVHDEEEGEALALHIAWIPKPVAVRVCVVYWEMTGNTHVREYRVYTHRERGLFI